MTLGVIYDPKVIRLNCEQSATPAQARLHCRSCAGGAAPIGAANARARAELAQIPEVENFLKFVEGSPRGVLV